MPSIEDQLAIREMIENWIIWRDAGDWDRFATLWHDDGWMVATWFEAEAPDFIARSRAAFENGLQVMHVQGGISITFSDGEATRAVSQSRMEIIQRAVVHEHEVDVSCHGRMVDAWEKRDGRWGLVHRQPVYERDRMDPVDPAVTIELDKSLLAQFPSGYRNLAYLQSQQGMHVSQVMPGTRGPEIESLMERMDRWLGGAASICLRAAPASAARAARAG